MRAAPLTNHPANRAHEELAGWAHGVIVPLRPTFSHKSPPDRRIRGLPGSVKSGERDFSCYDNGLQSIAHPPKPTARPVFTHLATPMKVSHQVIGCYLQRIYNKCEKTGADQRSPGATNGGRTVVQRPTRCPGTTEAPHRARLPALDCCFLAIAPRHAARS